MEQQFLDGEWLWEDKGTLFYVFHGGSYWNIGQEHNVSQVTWKLNSKAFFHIIRGKKPKMAQKYVGSLHAFYRGLTGERR